MMMVLPSQLAFKGSDITGTLGRIEKANTENPELVIDTEGGEVRYIGKFVLTSSLYFTVKLQPRQQSSVCEDVFDRVLVFENPKTNQINTSSSSKDLSGEYITEFGCSARGDPLTGKSGKDDDELEEDEDDDGEEVLPTRSLPSRAKKETIKSYVDKGSESDVESDDDVMVIDDSSSEVEAKRKKKITPKPEKPRATSSVSKSSSAGKNVLNKPSNSSSAKKRKVIDDDDDDYENDDEVEYVPRATSRNPRSSTKKIVYKEEDNDETEFDEDEEDDFSEDDDSDSDFSEGAKKKK